MSCPGNIDRLVAIVSKMGRGELTNDRIIMIAGGKDEDWGKHLKGGRVAALVQAANLKLESANLQLVSEGIGRERWLPVTVAEAHRMRAEQRLRRMDAHLRNAHKAVVAIERDVRASQYLRDEASAWIALLEAEGSELNQLIFDEWAGELVKALPAPSCEAAGN